MVFFPLNKVAEVMRLKVRRRDGTIGRFKKDHRSSFSEGAGGDLFRSGESQKVKLYYNTAAIAS